VERGERYGISALPFGWRWSPLTRRRRRRRSRQPAETHDRCFSRGPIASCNVACCSANWSFADPCRTSIRHAPVSNYPIRWYHGHRRRYRQPPPSRPPPPPLLLLPPLKLFLASLRVSRLDAADVPLNRLSPPLVKRAERQHLFVVNSKPPLFVSKLSSASVNHELLYFIQSVSQSAHLHQAT